MLRLCIFLLFAAKTLAAGCDTVQQVGVEFGDSGPIPDASMTTNSQINKWHGPWQGRLNNYQLKPETSRGIGAWCADKRDGVTYRYLEIDMGLVRKIRRIATQGRNITGKQWVKSYQISYSTDGNIFPGIKNGNTFKIFAANTDQNSIVYNDLPSTNSAPLMARYIRVQPVEFRGNICMRVELYECVEPTTEPPTMATSPPPACPAGFRLSANNVTCTDVDECDLGTDQCTDTCHNTNGSYTCSCNSGYRLQEDGKTCSNINECTENISGCTQVCVDTDGSFECRCKSGYQLQADNKTCLDKDECALGIHQCAQNCHNTDGTYTCSCRSGYRLSGDRKKCSNIDECAENISGCTQDCIDNVGSFECKCFSGYQLQGDKKTCLDINECAANNGGCSHTCVNLNGTHYCSCPSGYEVDSATRRICQDKNECAQANGGCQHVCTNTNGSYVCSCNSGFKLSPDKLTCEDIDECMDGSAQCDPQSTTCNNFIPGYECKCKDGYTTIQNNKYKCKARSCGALVATPGTNVSPATCLKDQGSVVGDVCTFSCDAGYELPSDKTALVCQASANWNDSIISCQRVSCPKLTAPAYGNLRPHICRTTGNLYLEKCYYSCNSGYQISGVSTKTCQSNGQWDSQEEPNCNPVFPDPWITCPDHVIVTLSTGASKSDVSALLDAPQSNQPPERIEISPEQYNSNKVFPAGTTSLTYTASNPVNKTASCHVSIDVQDKEDPMVSDCPLSIYKLITKNEEAVSWTPPTFSDNVGVVSVTSTRNPGDTFGQGRFLVKYTAKDAENNMGVCEFNVTVKRKECADPPPPDNGQITCNYVGSSKFCQVACNQNKKMYRRVFFVSCSEGNWDEVPDCVDYVNPAGNGSCSSPYVKQSGDFPENICVKCPRGMYYDMVTKTCKNCAVGYKSSAEGSLQCEACPPKTSTEVEGSKTCTAQCFAGHFSQSGFDIPANLSPCEPCPKDTYQENLGQKTCDKCPNGTTTIAVGSTSSAECGGPPTITQFGPNPTNAFENNRTQFECYGNGLPLPTFYINKVVPPPVGFGGPVTQEYIQDKDGNQIGLRHIITKVTEYDKGAYECKVLNKFGIASEFMTVTVKLDFSNGKRRRRRRPLRLRDALRA